VETARLPAVLNTAQADAFIACWDAKFTYWSERPVTASDNEAGLELGRKVAGAALAANGLSTG
jgi:hypothetical protein